MPTLFKKHIPDYVFAICQKLYNAHFRAYLVGGAIRDLALGQTPKDFDITTDATPDQVENLFPHTAPTGKKYGTITVILESGITLEVTTFRKDANYTDGRRPDYVTYSSNLHDDLSRRDFTINAIAYDPLHDLVDDPFNGLEDIEKHLLQTVGDASERIREDALRMMRAVRIKAEKGFTMANSLQQAIQAHTHLINHVSTERIAEELCRIITSNQPTAGIYDLLELRLLKHIIPELYDCVKVEQRQDYHKYDVFGHIAHSLQYSKPDLVVRLALLLHDIGKPAATSVDKKGIIHFYGHEVISATMALSILERLKVSNQIKNQVIPLIRYHMYNIDSNKALRKLMSKLKSPEQAQRFAQIRYADKMAGQQQSEILHSNYLANLNRIANILEEKTPLQISDLSISGKDIIKKLEIEPGPVVGTILDQLLQMTLDQPDLNHYEIMLELIPKIYSKQFTQPPKD